MGVADREEASRRCPPPRVGALVPAPHNRACPGPKDGQNSALCGVKGSVTFETTASEVLLSRGRATVWLQRLEGFGGTASVNYRVVDGSARAGVQFLAAQGSVSWLASEAQPKPVGSQNRTMVTIIDTNAVTGTLAMQKATATVGEARKRGSGFAKLTITRTGGSDCNATVHYRTVAVGGAGDRGYYGITKLAQAGSVAWAEGEGAAKTIRIPLTNDALSLPNQQAR
ncbi:hypothetical protein T484DRAFT_1797866 [Baffinella frigidus]|nr:hypothetical protein T484DRAFT_1797866 [Cryptophyta sp. CCMP2293]